ncbi:hypothetical protein Bhyg_17182 [Pseudolycoriella hygida]|uniref:Uncharacterized protein n=1 Tax=Pseudolycoriella hygida TaxID=35572 RepID=A0A9Q0MI20_9DIPT|nr:hypothetical protein Bhyg_17182 [Pseudolycoriella hygida]
MKTILAIIYIITLSYPHSTFGKAIHAGMINTNNFEEVKRDAVEYVPRRITREAFGGYGVAVVVPNPINNSGYGCCDRGTFYKRGYANNKVYRNGHSEAFNRFRTAIIVK